MNAPFIEPAHSRFGGSVAPRILRCPASVRLVEKVPEHLRRSSAYAKRGTALHAAMALLLGDNPPPLESLVGETISDYTITADDVEMALRPVYSYVEALLDAPGAEHYLEHRVVFPTIVGAFGTIDLLVRIGNVAYVIDAKFGVGVRVLALYPDGGDDVLNAQLMFYAAAARHSHPEFFAGVDNIILTILQPMSIEPGVDMVSSVEVTHDELNEFITVYRAACERALSPSPRLERGAWCRFCAARPICPAHTGPLLDFAQFMVPTPATPPSKEAYLQLLADGLNLVDAVKDISTALRNQANGERRQRAWLHTLGRPSRAPLARRGAHRNRRAGGPRARATTLLPRRCARRNRSNFERKCAASKSRKNSSFRTAPACRWFGENARAPMPGRGEIVRSFSEALKTIEGKEKG
jgi:hypothetical protein